MKKAAGRLRAHPAADITLINFFLSKTPTGGAFACVPLGVLYLAGALETQGYRAQVLDYQLVSDANPYDSKCVAAFLEEAGSNLIGISSMTNMLPFLVLGLREFRAKRPDVHIVIGGSGVSGIPEAVLQACPEIDAVVSGDGEESVVALVREYQGRRDWSKVPGLTWREDSRGVVRMPQKPRAKNIDDIAPPAYHHLKPGLYEEFPILTSRGCPYHCVFCDIAPNGGRRVGNRSVSRVVEEIADIRSGMDLKVFSVLDDVFSLNRHRVDEFCKTLIRERLEIEWGCMCRTDLLGEELMDLMWEAGCRRLFLGVESGSEQVRKRAGKGLGIENVESTIASAAQRFHVNASFILGFPFESMADFEQTLQLAMYATIIGAHPQISILSPLPSADLTHSGEYPIAFDAELVSGIAYPRRGEAPAKIAGEILTPEIQQLIRKNPRIYSAFYHFPEGRVREKLERARTFGLKV